jgi:periplasmic divalent cation tolerance protein
MAKALEVHITAPDRAQAEALARMLVDQRLAACVNIVGGVRSIYRWDDQIQEADEVLCLVKTRPELLGPLTDRVRAAHPYEVPEILAFEVEEGNEDYLRWLDSATTPLDLP